MAVRAHRALLVDAHSLRRGDLDGLGNLSEQALVAWADYVLETCLDQARFWPACRTLRPSKPASKPAWCLKPPCANRECAKRPCAACSSPTRRKARSASLYVAAFLV